MPHTHAGSALLPAAVQWGLTTDLQLSPAPLHVAPLLQVRYRVVLTTADCQPPLKSA